MRRFILTILLIAAPRACLPACETAEMINAIKNNDGIPLPLTRPVMQRSWNTPDGFFKIHYNIDGPLAVYHPGEDNNPQDGIPDYVNRTADFLALSFEAIITELEFDPPPFDDDEGGDSLYDVYLTAIPGLTSPENRSSQYPGRDAYTSYIRLGHDMRTPRHPDDPYPFLKVTAAHEFFHAVEFAYRLHAADTNPWWWFEACAGWAEDVVFDDINENYLSLSEYLPDLHRSLYATDGLFGYGAWLFPQYLSESIGPFIIRDCWLKFASFDFSLDAVNLALIDQGEDFHNHYGNHIIWNYFTGENYRAGFYSEAEAFSQTVFEARRHSSFPVPWLDQPIAQENVSGAYIVFESLALENANLIIEYLNTSEEKHSVAIAVVRTEGGIETEVYEIQNNMLTTIVIEDFNSCEKVVMMPIWTYEGAPIGGTTGYQYQAYLDPVDPVATGESGAPVAGYKLLSAYPNPFNGALSIAFDSPGEDRYSFSVYDLAGRLITRAEGICLPGLNYHKWIPPDDLAGGVLFYNLEISNFSQRGKALYLK